MEKLWERSDHSYFLNKVAAQMHLPDGWYAEVRMVDARWVALIFAPDGRTYRSKPSASVQIAKRRAILILNAKVGGS